jgi:MFS family permease
LERTALIVGSALAAGALGLSGAIPIFAAVALLFVVVGVGNAFLNVALVLMVQRWAPPQLQGRTMAAVEAVANTSVGISLLVGGLLLAPLGARGVYLLAGGLGAVAVIVALQIPRQQQPIQPELQPVDPPDAGDRAKLDPFSRRPVPAPA